MAQEVSRSGELCNACGLCCLGVVHSHAALNANELSLAQSLSLQVAMFDDGLGFCLPCPQYQGNLCATYQHRPRACTEYQCELLQRFLAGEVTLDGALNLIAQAKVMLDDLWAQVPGGKATPLTLSRIRAIVAKPSSLSHE